MAHVKQAILDSLGKPHAHPDGATVSDLERVLGNPALARVVFEKRAQVEELFRQHDAVVKALT